MYLYNRSMREMTYEQPREKMLSKGVSALSQRELLQVIIGSGTAGVPVTKIARSVDKIVQTKGEGIAMSDLLPVKGLGTVKAGQLIAGIELAARISQVSTGREPTEYDVVSDLYADIRKATKQTLIYVLYDGGGRLLDDHTLLINPSENASKIVRQVFAAALAQSTASIGLIIGFDNQPLEPTMYELGFARDAYRTAQLLSVPIRLFVLVSHQGEYSLRRLSNG